MKIRTSTMLAVSMAGHDKGTVHVVLGESEDGVYVFLADGRRRRLEQPKRKKKKHVQLIRELDEELLQKMQEISLDAHIRKILQAYKSLNETKKEIQTSLKTKNGR